MARPNVKIIPKTFPTLDSDAIVRGDIAFTQVVPGATQQFIIGRLGGGQEIIACKLKIVTAFVGLTTATCALGTVPILTTGVRTFSPTMIAATDVTALSAVLTLAAAGGALDTSGAVASNPTGEYDIVMQVVSTGAGPATAGRVRAIVDTVSFPGPGGGGVPPFSQ
jgi:hypothetical protein